MCVSKRDREREREKLPPLPLNSISQGRVETLILASPYRMCPRGPRGKQRFLAMGSRVGGVREKAGRSRGSWQWEAGLEGGIEKEGRAEVAGDGRLGLGSRGWHWEARLGVCERRRELPHPEVTPDGSEEAWLRVEV